MPIMVKIQEAEEKKRKESRKSIKSVERGLPWWLSGKNLPVNAGKMDLIPDPRRSHVAQSNAAHAPQLLNLCSRAWEQQLLKPKHLESALQQEKALQ